MLVARHGTAVRLYAQALVSDVWSVDEVVQITFVRAWKYLDSFRGEGCFEGWLLRICRNCAADLVARRKPEPTDDVPVAVVATNTEVEVVALLASLPVAQRETLMLCGPLGYSYEAAAELLNVPVGTIRSRLARGRARLAELVAGAETA